MNKLTPAQKGLLTGISMILASVFSLLVLKNPVESYFQFIVYFMFTAGIVWSLLSYSKIAGEKNSFKDYFSIGFKTFVVVALLMAVFTYIYFSIHTEFRDTKIAENSRLLITQGNHLPNEIEENSRRLKNMFMPFMVSSAIFRYLLTGALVSMIAAGFLNKRKM